MGAKEMKLEIVTEIMGSYTWRPRLFSLAYIWQYRTDGLYGDFIDMALVALGTAANIFGVISFAKDVRDVVKGIADSIDEASQLPSSDRLPKIVAGQTESKDSVLLGYGGTESCKSSRFDYCEVQRRRCLRRASSIIGTIIPVCRVFS